MKLKRDHCVGIALFLIGVAICAYTSQIQSHFAVDGSDVGPRLFPYITGIGIALCGIFTFLTTKRSEADKPFLDKDGWKRLGALLLLLIGYAVCLYLFGFLLSTPFMLFLLILLLAGSHKLNKLVVVVVSVTTSVLLYWLFVKILYVMLPRGALF